MKTKDTCIIDGQKCPLNETFTKVLFNGKWHEIFYGWWDDDTFIIVGENETKREIYFSI